MKHKIYKIKFVGKQVLWVVHGVYQNLIVAKCIITIGF